MVNLEHLAKLKEGIEKWNQWLEENQDASPDLRNAASATRTSAGGGPPRGGPQQGEPHGNGLRQYQTDGRQRTRHV